MAQSMVEPSDIFSPLRIIPRGNSCNAAKTAIAFFPSNFPLLALFWSTRKDRAKRDEFKDKYAMAVFAALHELPLGMFLKGPKMSDGSTIDHVINALSPTWVTRTRPIRTVAHFNARASKQLRVT
eukprot:1732026-Pyramimonas_sp.AAC.1